MQVIRMHEVIQKTKLSRSTIWRLYKYSDFPKPIQLTQRSVCFDLDQIEDWLNKRPQKYQR
jgi:prophage regulatory protein